MRNLLRTVLPAAAGAAIVLGGVAAWLVTRGGNDGPRTYTAAPHVRAPGTPSHSAYARLYANAVVHESRITVLQQWPRPPYQKYRSGAKTCYEWFDDPVALYSLCFDKGLLVDKSIT